MLAPPHSRCALHPVDEASFVCSRCGNFMCSTCAAGDAERCPACRALHPAAGFPFDQTATLEQLLSHALTSLQRAWQSCAIAAGLYVAILVGGSVLISVTRSLAMVLLMKVQEDVGSTGLLWFFQVGNVVQSLALVPLQALASLGLMRMMLDVVMGRSPSAGRFFSETRLMPRALAIQLPLSLLLVVPGLVSTMLGAVSPQAAGVVGLGWSCVVLPLLLAFGLSWWLFSIPELLISDCSAGEAMRRAWSLGRPWQNLRVLGYALLAGVLVLAGALACGVGVLAGLPFGTLLVLSLFLALRSGSDLAAATAL